MMIPLRQRPCSAERVTIMLRLGSAGCPPGHRYGPLDLALRIKSQRRPTGDHRARRFSDQQPELYVLLSTKSGIVAFRCPATMPTIVASSCSTRISGRCGAVIQNGRCVSAGRCGRRSAWRPAARAHEGTAA